MSGMSSRQAKPGVNPLGMLVLLVAALMLALTAAVLYWGTSRTTDVYRVALQKAQSDPRVTQALGTPIEDEWTLGSRSRNRVANGNADLAIPLHGPIDEGILYVQASKEAGEWRYSLLRVEVLSSHERIDLLAPASFPGL